MADLSVSQLNKFTKDELVERVLKVQKENTLLKDTLQTLQNQMNELSVAVTELRQNQHQQNNNLNVAVSELRENQQQQQNSIPSTTNTIQDKRIVSLEKNVHENQQYSRRDTIEIVGIPTTVAPADLELKVIDIFNEIDVQIECNQIQACHRLFDGQRTIIKFVNRKSAINILKNRHKLKEIDLSALNIPVTTKVYINESLCPHYRMLHGKLKALYKKKHIFSFWVSNGSVRYRRCEHGDYFTVQHLNDLIEAFGNLLD